MQTSSNALHAYIRDEIKTNGGNISFARFMQLALYHPEWGYYCRENVAIGKEGDFTTAPHLSPLFAHCFARAAMTVFPHLDKKNVLEIGAGQGQFAYDFLAALKEKDTLPDYYFIYEISKSLREKQQEFLKLADPDIFSRMVWLDKLPTHFSGLIIANEVLDALPVHCFRIDNDLVKERRVAYENDFVWQLDEPTKELKNAVELIQHECALYNGYESEINLGLDAFIETLAVSLSQGIILFADYGYGRREYYHPQRAQGTLTCFFQHTRHPNPLLHPGQQDITAHVDFSALAESAAAHGLNLDGFTTQAAFLFSCGLMELAEEGVKDLSPAQEFALHQAVKYLTLPTEMGERIKIMALSKAYTAEVVGFKLQDRRWDL